MEAVSEELANAEHYLEQQIGASGTVFGYYTAVVELAVVGVAFVAAEKYDYGIAAADYVAVDFDTADEYFHALWAE